MIDTTILVVAMGLMWMYGSVSLVTSQIQEALASALGLRSRMLVKAITDLVNDPSATGWALKLLNHALVNPQVNGQAKTLAELTAKPSYIPPDHFAAAVLDCIRESPVATGTLSDDFSKIADPQLRTLFLGIYSKAQGDISKVRDELAAWFDNAMDRASGAYKRRSQLYCFGIGFLVAVALNLDSLQVFQVLWNRPALLAALGSGSPPSTSSAALSSLQQLPIGWTGAPTFDLSAAGAINGLKMMLGWTLTALSVLFGAPFWFDLLQRIAQLRGTGAKPASA